MEIKQSCSTKMLAWLKDLIARRDFAAISSNNHALSVSPGLLMSFCDMAINSRLDHQISSSSYAHESR